MLLLTRTLATILSLGVLRHPYLKSCRDRRLAESHAHYLYLIIIQRVRVGYELAVIISYPTSASGIIVLLKTPTKYREILPTLFVKTTDFQLVFNFELTPTVTKSLIRKHAIMAHIP